MSCIFRTPVPWRWNQSHELWIKHKNPLRLERLCHEDLVQRRIRTPSLYFLWVEAEMVHTKHESQCTQRRTFSHLLSKKFLWTLIESEFQSRMYNSRQLDRHENNILKWYVILKFKISVTWKSRERTFCLFVARTDGTVGVLTLAIGDSCNTTSKDETRWTCAELEIKSESKRSVLLELAGSRQDTASHAGITLSLRVDNRRWLGYVHAKSVTRTPTLQWKLWPWRD